MPIGTLNSEYKIGICRRHIERETKKYKFSCTWDEHDNSLLAGLPRQHTACTNCTGLHTKDRTQIFMCHLPVACRQMWSQMDQQAWRPYIDHLVFSSSNYQIALWQKTDSPCLNCWASVPISEGCCFLLVVIVPQPYVPSDSNLVNRLMEVKKCPSITSDAFLWWILPNNKAPLSLPDLSPCEDSRQTGSSSMMISPGQLF